MHPAKTRQRIAPRIALEVETLERDRLGELLNTRRYCFVVPVDAFVPPHGFRVSIAIEGESGHYPTGDDAWIEGDGSARKPWFWGMTLDDAKHACAESNARMGLSPIDVAKIVASTMG